MLHKEWLEDKSIYAITFKTTTFFIHIHGLPSNLLNEKKRWNIGSSLGDLIPNNGKLLVA